MDLLGLAGRHIGQRKAGDALVILRQRAQFVLRDVFVEIIEWLVADQFLDLDIDEIRRVLAIGAHYFRGRLNARGLVGFQRLARIR